MEHVLGHGVVFTSKSMYLHTVISWNDYAKLGMLRRRGQGEGPILSYNM
jgi:hypothetical protein